MRFLIGFVPLALMAQSAAPSLSTATLLHRVEPAYTAEARAAGLQGAVSLYVEVGRDGKPSNVQVMQGLGLGLDEAAVHAVKQWEFRANSGAGDIEDVLDVDLNFRLDSPKPWFVDSETYGYVYPQREPPGDTEPPVPIRYVAPEATACREAGAIPVRLIVGTNGAAREVKPVGNAPADALIKAVEAWRFTPAKRLGKSIEAHASVIFRCWPEGQAMVPPADSGPPYPPAKYRTSPVLVSKVEPEYTERARLGKLEGTVTISLQVSAEGKATNIHVTRMLGLGLDQKAMEAVKKWQFKPAMNLDKPVTMPATVAVNFRLL